MDGVTVNFSNFREKWLGLTEQVRLLLEVFQQHRPDGRTFPKNPGYCCKVISPTSVAFFSLTTTPSFSKFL